LGSWETSIRQIAGKKKDKTCTFYHLDGRKGISSMLQMTGHVIEQEEAKGKAICLALKDVDRAVDLGDEFCQIKISIAILAWLEHETGLSAV
jgi:hypothetical protein